MEIFADPASNSVIAVLALLLALTWWSAKAKPALQVNGQLHKLSSEDIDADAVAKLIRQRRSVFPKDLSGGEVSREQVEQLLEAANWAPTHGRTEPWRFVVLGKEGQQQMLDLSLQVGQQAMSSDRFEKYKAKQMKKRPQYGKVSHMIMICMKRQANPDKLMPEWEELAATSSAMQNLQLMTSALGLGGYWSSWAEEARDAAVFKQFLGLGAEDKCLGVFLLGQPGPAVSSYRSSRSPIADKVTWLA